MEAGMDEYPKEWLGFKFHLITAAALRVVASVLVGLSLLLCLWEWESHPEHGVVMTSRCIGLPFPVLRFGTMYGERYVVFSGTLLCVDIVIWLLILGVTYLVCEIILRRIRRKERHP
jgi:hypothetical protein